MSQALSDISAMGWQWIVFTGTVGIGVAYVWQFLPALLLPQAETGELLLVKIISLLILLGVSVTATTYHAGEPAGICAILVGLVGVVVGKLLIAQLKLKTM